MVLKHYKKYNTGNTVRANVSRRCKSKNDFEIVTNGESWNTQDLDQGTDEKFESGVSYSTNKRGRWQLKDRWMNKVSSNANKSDGEHLIVIEERVDINRKRGNCRKFVTNRPDCAQHERDRVRTFMNGKSLMGEACLKSERDVDQKKELSNEDQPVSRSKKRRDQNIKSKVPVESVKTVTFYSPLPSTSALGCNSDIFSVTNKKFQKGKQTQRGRIMDIDFSNETFYDDEMEIFESVEEEIRQEALMESLEVETMSEKRKNNFFVFTEEQKQKKEKKLRRKTRSSSSSDEDFLEKNSWVYFDDRFEENIFQKNENSLEPSMDLTDPIVMIPKYVIINKKDISPSNLERMYSESYEESNSFPRQILIDISKQVVKSWKYEGPQVNRLATLIIMENNESYSDCTDKILCTIRLNLCLENSGKSELPFLTNGETYSIDEIVKLALQDATLKEMSRFIIKRDNTNKQLYLEDDVHSTLSGVCMSHVKGNIASGLTQDLTTSTSSTEMVPATSASKKITMCGICLEPLLDFDQSLTETSSYGLELNQCGHTFCPECWRQHLTVSIRMGSLKLQCAEPMCDTIVDTVTCLSLVSLRLYVQHKSLVDTVTLEADPRQHWCPNHRCNRLLRLVISPKSIGSVEQMRPVTLECVCKTIFCSQCREDAHWPSSCEASRNYADQLQKMGYLSLSWKDSKLRIKGKSCPKCGNFIEKNGGCNHMTCRCGCEFCWYCMGKYDNSTHPNGPCTSKKHEYVYKQQQIYDFAEKNESSIISTLNKTKCGHLLALALSVRRLRLETQNKSKRELNVKNLCNMMAKESGLTKKVLDSRTYSSIMDEYRVLHHTVGVIMTKLEEFRRIIENIFVSAWYQYKREPTLSSRLHNQANRLLQLHDRIVFLIDQRRIHPTGYSGRSSSRCEAILDTFNYAQTIIRGTARISDKHFSTSNCKQVVVS